MKTRLDTDLAASAATCRRFATGRRTVDVERIKALTGAFASIQLCQLQTGSTLR